MLSSQRIRGHQARVALIAAVFLSVTYLFASPPVATAQEPGTCLFARIEQRTNGVVRVCFLDALTIQVDAKINSPEPGLLGFADHGFRNPEVSGFDTGSTCLSFVQGLQPGIPLTHALLIDANFNTLDLAPLAADPPPESAQLEGCLHA